MGPVAGGIIQAGIGAIGGFLGGERKNRTDQKEAQRNRSFQERMRNTQWQAAVEDMRQAGINPALAYQQGPNAAPGGSATPPAENSVSSAIQAGIASQQLRLMKAQADSAGAQASIDKETARVQSTRTGHLGNQSYIERMANFAEDMQLLGIDQAKLGLARGNVNLQRDAHLRDITGVGAGLANTFGIWGPILGGLAAPGGIGISSARGVSKLLRNAAARRRVRAQLKGMR